MHALHCAKYWFVYLVNKNFNSYIFLWVSSLFGSELQFDIDQLPYPTTMLPSIATRVVAGRYRPPVVIKSEHISGIKAEDEDTHAYHLDTDNEDDQDDRHIKNEVIKKEEYGTTDDEGEGDTDDDETDDECGK
mgnify:CR=1 FL=1